LVTEGLILRWALGGEVDGGVVVLNLQMALILSQPKGLLVVVGVGVGGGLELKGHLSVFLVYPEGSREGAEEGDGR